MGERVDVDALLGDGRRVAAGFRFDHRGLAQPRRLLRHLGELAGELAELQVLRLLPDQPERGDLPERGGSAVAEDDPVSVGQREQLGEPGLDPGDQALDRLLAVGRSEHARPRRGEGCELLGAYLGGPGAEPAVRGLDVGGNHYVSHGCKPSDLARCSGRRAAGCANIRSPDFSSRKLRRYFRSGRPSRLRGPWITAAEASRPSPGRRERPDCASRTRQRPLPGQSR